MSIDARPVVGFIGLGDQGLPMATAIAQAGFELHVWARRAASLDGLAGIHHIRHGTAAELAAVCDIVELCVSTDADVLHLVENMLDALRPGTVVVNHGTGTPATATRVSRLCATRGVEALDAPVSGGRPAAEARALTTLVGGPDTALARCRPVFESFARHIVHLGPTGTGQLAKLFNNALLMMNQAAIADILAQAETVGLPAVTLADALKLGSGTSAALTLMNTMVTADTVEHLSAVEEVEINLFDTALREAGAEPGHVTARGLSGARRLDEVVGRLTR